MHWDKEYSFVTTVLISDTEEQEQCPLFAFAKVQRDWVILGRINNHLASREETHLVSIYINKSNYYLRPLEELK